MSLQETVKNILLTRMSPRIKIDELLRLAFVSSAIKFYSVFLLKIILSLEFFALCGVKVEGLTMGTLKNTFCLSHKQV